MHLRLSGLTMQIYPIPPRQQHSQHSSFWYACTGHGSHHSSFVSDHSNHLPMSALSWSRWQGWISFQLHHPESLRHQMQGCKRPPWTLCYTQEHVVSNDSSNDRASSPSPLPTEPASDDYEALQAMADTNNQVHSHSFQLSSHSHFNFRLWLSEPGSSIQLTYKGISSPILGRPWMAHWYLVCWQVPSFYLFLLFHQWYWLFHEGMTLQSSNCPVFWLGAQVLYGCILLGN